MASNLPADAAVPRRPLNVVAGVLSYLVPGLGQIVQGRVAKGLLFFVCVYTLFFYGLYIGSGAVTVGGRPFSITGNVYLPDAATPNGTWLAILTQQGPPPPLVQNLYSRPQFLGQVWVGVAAWPAIFQYRSFNRDRHVELEEMLKEAADRRETNPEEAKKREERAAEVEKELAHPVFGTFQREPSQATINAVHNAGDKRLELAWVFTVIAGVLNILVIYDAAAGPAFVLAPSPKKEAY